MICRPPIYRAYLGKSLICWGCDESEIIHISAKTGQNVDKVLDAVVERIPAPVGEVDGPTRALIFDSYYDDYRGVIYTCGWLMGELKRVSLSE